MGIEFEVEKQKKWLFIANRSFRIILVVIYGHFKVISDYQ